MWRLSCRVGDVSGREKRKDSRVRRLGSKFRSSGPSSQITNCRTGGEAHTGVRVTGYGALGGSQRTAKGRWGANKRASHQTEGMAKRRSVHYAKGRTTTTTTTTQRGEINQRGR